MTEEEKFNKLTDAVQAIQVTLARLEGKIDSSSDSHKDVVEDVKDHEVRLRALEALVPFDHQKQHVDQSKFRWIVVGAAGVAGGLASEIAKFL